MQFLAYFLATLGCIFLAFTYNKKRSPKPSTKRVAPEPPGALPIIGHLHLLRGSSPLALKLGALADQYGPIYSLRLGSRPTLVVNSSEMVKECLTTNDINFATRPDSAFVQYMSFDGASFGLAPYGSYWRDIKKMVTSKLFSSQALHRLTHVWDSETKFLIRDLYTISQSKGHHVNLTKHLDQEMLNIIIAIISGKRLSSDQVKTTIKKGWNLIGSFVVSDFIPSLKWMDIGGYVKRFQQSSKELDGVAREWLEEHIEKEVSGDTDEESDFIHVMLSELPKETHALGYTRDHIIRATIVTLLLTGTGTPTETMIWVFALLVNNPRIKKIAQDELDVHVGRDKWVEVSDLNKLEYLQAIVKETLRLYPTGPLAAPRKAAEDCYVGGYYVPKGTRVMLNIWKVHHDSQVWPDPYEFLPERFLHESSGANHAQNFEYIPFSAGRRSCPGGTFGLQVVHLTVARLLQGFDLSTPMGKRVDMTEGVGLGLPKVGPLEVVLTPRLSSELYQKL